MRAVTRTVLIIGAQGVLGSTLARCFEGRGWVVLRGGRRLEEEAASRLVDLDRPDTVRDAISGADLVVDVVPHPGLVPERMVLRTGGRLIDVSARPFADGLALRAEVCNPRGLVVLNAGRTPGISSLVAAHLLNAHPEADEIEIAFSFSAAGAGGRAAAKFAHRNLTAKRRHRTGLLPFPRPVGPHRCLEFAESERGWLGELARDRRVTTYVRFAPRALNAAFLAVNALGLMSILPRTMFVQGTTEPHASEAREPVIEWIAVRARGRRLAASTIEGRGGYLMTADATAVLAEALLDRAAPAEPGCFQPYELFSLQHLERQLSRSGIRIVRHRIASIGGIPAAGPIPKAAPQNASVSG